MVETLVAEIVGEIYVVVVEVGVVEQVEGVDFSWNNGSWYLRGLSWCLESSIGIANIRCLTRHCPRKSADVDSYPRHSVSRRLEVFASP